jgi:hypothetical protein
MATIELTAQHNPLAWLLYFAKLTVVGSFRYLGAQRGPATISVPVTEGAPVRLRYTMPPWMYANGRLEVVG